jgi:hypothetical protein
MDVYFGGEPKGMQEACDRPVLTIAPHWEDPKGRSSKPTSFYCKKLHVLAIPVHITREKTIESYMVITSFKPF